VGGVLAKTCIIALSRSTFLKENQIHHASTLHGFAHDPLGSYCMNAHRSSFNS